METYINGWTNRYQRFIHCTNIIRQRISVDSPVMQGEIFGPILPIIEYDKLDDAIAFVNSRNKPLALYIFSDDKMYQERILNETSSGNASINECLMHVA
jgi:aldehyde dehydrogenase (NAD+)